MATASAAKTLRISNQTGASNAPTVLVTDKDVDLSQLREKFQVIQFIGDGAMPRDQLKQQVANVDALYCLVRDKINKEVLDAAKKLKVVSTMSVGFDHIDIQECKKRNIIVTNTPDVLTETTAELTIALLLATARRLPEGVEEVKKGRWGTWAPFYMCGVGIQESTVGIIGFGRIGCSVIEKLKVFHPSRIIYSDVFRNEKKAAEMGVEFVQMDDLFAKSDFIIVTCSMTDKNRGFINKESLSKMKNNAVLINTSRGGLVNHQDLYEALKEGRIRAAGIDVTDPEPLPTSSPLLELSNCVVLPHIGSATLSTRERMMHLAEDGILAVLTNSKIPDRIRVV
uniref:Glyoxylate reductase/hydroxypyruvate reductase n=1 Tax=Parascaris univalens TaxID=6257 RepID=A0A914ZI86_PARUN